MEYNSTREKLTIPEYGRNIHKMVEFTLSIEDRNRRTKAAKMIIAIMGTLNNIPREQGDIRQKLWDHLFVISDFKLDIDSPYPKPNREHYEQKPAKCSYPHSGIQFKQYGKSVELMIQETIKYEDGPEKNALIRYIANHLKKMYLNWNRETVNDEVIVKHLALLSGGKLELNEDTKLENTNDIIARNRKKKPSSNVPPGRDRQNRRKPRSQRDY